MATSDQEIIPPNNLPKSTVHITTHDKAGKAIIHSSTPGSIKEIPARNLSFNTAYTTSVSPPVLTDDVDLNAYQDLMTAGTLALVNPNGTVLRIVDFGPASKPVMHRTQSLDYGVVLEGEIEMELDGGEKVRMVRGDVAVQRGTMHLWRNVNTGGWSRMLFVLMECAPVVVNGEELKPAP